MASNVKTVDALAIASVKTFCGLAIASAGTINGVDNTSSFTYLVNEDFETTGTPTHWFMADTADFDYTTSPLAGSQSLSITTAGTPSNVGYANGTNGAVLNEVEVWGKFLFRADSFTDSYSRIGVIANGSGTAQLVLYIRASGALAVQDLSGAILVETTDVMSAGSNYRVYFHYVKGSGSNAVCSCGFATTDSRPTSGNKFAGGTNGTSASNAEWIQFIPTGTSGTQFIIDNVQLATTTFN